MEVEVCFFIFFVPAKCGKSSFEIRRMNGSEVGRGGITNPVNGANGGGGTGSSEEEDERGGGGGGEVPR